MKKAEMGEVPVLDIRPESWQDDGKVLVYNHGGAYPLFSAASTVISSVPVPHDTGLRVVSVDYTTPLFAKHGEVTDQVSPSTRP